MRLTKRGRGLVAGLIIAAIGVVGYSNNDGGQYIMEGGEPQKVEQRIEEDEPGWDCTTMGNEYCGTDAGMIPQGDWNWDVDTESDQPGGIAGGAYNEDPMNPYGEPATNPCPWELAQTGACEF